MNVSSLELIMMFISLVMLIVLYDGIIFSGTGARKLRSIAFNVFGSRADVAHHEPLMDLRTSDLAHDQW
jgi:hypothetical protein